MREVLIGFDSAWTDSTKNPGAIAACVFEGAQCATFYPPRLATFEAALQFIDEWTTEADYVLIAIDQPTIVPNHDGARPVDRVAASLVSKLRGGVQPARRGGIGAPMFGEGAPIWGFLATVGAIQNPTDARNAATGRFLMEVFPALALPAIVPAIWQRCRAAKYNPVARNFELHDWRMVASGVGTFAHNLGAHDLADWLTREAFREMPRKADQDQLDAAICLTIALAWRCGLIRDTLQIGDERFGYIATIVSAEIRAVLAKAAAEQKVAVDRVWEGTAAFVSIPPARLQQFSIQPEAPKPHQTSHAISVAMLSGNEPIRVFQRNLRALLIDRARSGNSITYGEVAAALGHRWSQGFGASLTRALNALADENNKAGEPLLMCLVVNKATGLPGKGFYATTGQNSTDIAMLRSMFDHEVERCRKWRW